MLLIIKSTEINSLLNVTMQDIGLQLLIC